VANTATKSTTKTAKQAAKKASGGAKRAARTASSTAKSTAKKATTATGASRAKKTGARRSTRSSQDAIAFLKSEHRDVEDLFKKFEQLGDGAHKSREATVGKIIEALSKHAAIEEEILYPEIRERVEKGGDDDDMVLEALEEHHVAKATLAEIERLPSEDERFKAKVTVLMESVRHHVEEEEDELFPKVRDMFSKSELDEMGARLKAARQSAPSRPHPMAPDEPPGNIIANTLTAPLDATVAVAGGAARAVRRAVR
jgi:hemerythrin superfamily protein